MFNKAKATLPPHNAGAILLPLARAAIASALGGSEPMPPTPTKDDAWLQAPGASFVTLTQHGRLRGCIGTLEAHRPLCDDIAHNAVAAALHDTRFTPLSLAELADTEIEVSVLTPMQPMQFDSEADALRQLRVGVDGVVFEFDGYRSTFLPQVWEQLPSASEFMAHLKRKAGLASDFWSSSVNLKRYTVHQWTESGASP
jgi:AmmeMemoRadiSam system protein A